MTGGKRNPRYIVTDLTGREEWALSEAAFADGQALYEEVYCARGDMENRIKEQRMDMFADRTSTAHLKSNQLRLWFSTFAYICSCGRCVMWRWQALGWRKPRWAPSGYI